MEKTTFGQRLKIAFGNAKQAEIASKLGVSEAAVKNYSAGRVPDDKKLLLIRELTKCSLDWLLTGEGSQFVAAASTGLLVGDEIHKLLFTIAKEQARVVYADVEIAGENINEATLKLLTEYLLYRALESVNLATDDLISNADRKRAERFTFVANQPQSLEDRIGELVEKKIQAGTSSLLDREGELRDMIRELVIEETGKSRKRPVYPLVLSAIDDDEIETRKAG